jgi:TatA/E family protein of Tat protein translocase
MWSLGWQETVVIFLLALVIFGPKKLPELGKNLAKGLAEFRRASSELKATFDREMANIERETGELKEVSQQFQNEVTNYDSYYENSYYDSGYDGTSTSESTAQESSTTASASATQGADSTPAIESATGPGESSAAGETGAQAATETAKTAGQPVTEPAVKS